MASELEEDGNGWELSKENVRLLPGGRSAAAINEAFQKQEATDCAEQLRRQKIAFETEIRLYSGEDPLDVWDRYVNWTVQMFPQEGKGSCLSELLEQVIDRFKDEAIYHNDMRFVGHCLKFASSLLEPIDLYNYMYSVGIGKNLARFYISWATEYEMQENYKQASDVITNGIQQNAQPLDKLHCYQRQLDSCLARRIITQMSEAQDEPEETTSQEEQRMAFAALKVVGKKAQAPVIRVGSTVSGPPGIINMQPKSGHQQQCRQTFIPLDEKKLVMPPEILDEQPWLAPPPRTAQENDVKPKPWNKIRYKKNPSGGLHNDAPSRPSFVTYVDEPGANPDPSIPTPRKLDPLTNNVLSARKPAKSEGFLERIQNHDTNDKTKVMYCKDKLDAGLQEFSMEELRAERYKQKICRNQMLHQDEKKAKEKMEDSLQMERLQLHNEREKCGMLLEEVVKTLNEMKSMQVWPPAAGLPVYSQGICTQDEVLCQQEPPLPLRKNIQEMPRKQNPAVVPSLQENQQPTAPRNVLSDKSTIKVQSLNLNQLREPEHSPLHKRSCPASLQSIKPFEDQSTVVQALDLENGNEMHKSNENSFPSEDNESLAKKANPNSSVLQRSQEANTSAVTPKQLSAGPSSNLTSPSPYRQQDPTFNTKEAMDEPPNAFAKNAFTIFEESLITNRSDVKKNLDEPSSPEYMHAAAGHENNPSQKSEDLDGFDPMMWNHTTDAMAPPNQTLGWIPENTRQFAQLAPLMSTPFSVCQDTHDDADENSENKLMKPDMQRPYQGISCFMRTYTSPQKRLSPIGEISNETARSSSSSSCASITSLKTTPNTDSIDPQAKSATPVQSDTVKILFEGDTKPEETVATLSSQSCMDKNVVMPSSLPSAPRLKPESQSSFRHSVVDENAENKAMHLKDNLLKEPQQIQSGCIVERPWNPVLIESLLSQLKTPLESLPNFFCSNECIPNINLTSKLQLGPTMYHVQSLVGDGAFAKVYCAVASKPDGFDEKVALKVQMPAHPWEFYMCTQLKARLSPVNLDLFINVNSEHIYQNGSILIGELHTCGSLLDVANWLHQQTAKISHQALLLYMATTMLYVVEQLHMAGIIHTDIKPDNFVLTNRWSYNIEDCLSSRLVLIDFGQSIDLSLFPSGTVFKGSSETSAFQCIEMLTDQPWKFQPDYFGIASTMHCLIFGKYMEVYKDGDLWKMKSTLKRWHFPVWNHFFSTLLNARDCHSTNILVDLRAHLLQFMKNDERTFQSYLMSVWRDFCAYLNQKVVHKK
ncbi:unnamed protein product [Lampetra planeri]